ncbi:unnamed protein product [Enterobius vermicularis]|uniref:GB1/RHD3-type G domain-containing protein n=1 Tax=Enterobius vermicularis TaxID=51028 RepID=A0A0N4UTF3_ENTVE|nr:unnamed protein product [Enterobius vermicularis]
MDECDSKNDHAVTVIQKSTDGAWIPDVEALNKILKSKNIINKKVMVVSIAGPSRSGKSFLLNLILKAFYAAEQGRWVQEDMTMATNNFGFRCRGGARRETSGIALWSKPFLFKNEEDEELAVLLMDTEGFFDADSTLEDCAKIFSLSSLLSSLQIYNLKEKLQLDFLKHVEIFGKYGSYATKKEKAKPFQNLLYLVRDWSCEEDYESIEEDFLEMTRALAEELCFGRFLGAKEILRRELTCQELCAFFIVSGEVVLDTVYLECTETYDNEIDTVPFNFYSIIFKAFSIKNMYA